jgi:hypothetical protein
LELVDVDPLLLERIVLQPKWQYDKHHGDLIRPQKLALESVYSWRHHNEPTLKQDEDLQESSLNNKKVFFSSHSKVKVNSRWGRHDGNIWQHPQHIFLRWWYSTDIS